MYQIIDNFLGLGLLPYYFILTFLPYCFVLICFVLFCPFIVLFLCICCQCRVYYPLLICVHMLYCVCFGYFAGDAVHKYMRIELNYYVNMPLKFNCCRFIFCSIHVSFMDFFFGFNNFPSNLIQLSSA